MTHRLEWGDEALTLTFTWSEEAPFALSGVRTPGVRLDLPEPIALVHILTEEGRRRASTRLTDTTVGLRLRYAGHERSIDDSTLTVALVDPSTGLSIGLRLRRTLRAAAWSASVDIVNTGEGEVLLRAVTPWAASFGAPFDHEPDARSWNLLTGRSEWMAENRWSVEPLQGLLPEISTGRHAPHGSVVRHSRGTNGTDGFLPVGGVQHADSGITWLWQAENSGGWRWEVGAEIADGYVAVSGPTEADNGWDLLLEPGERFVSIDASIALGDRLDTAVEALTAHRRARRHPHSDNRRPAIVFNDYMNTLQGDPDEAKLLPLIDAVGTLGVDVFCIDAGWYAEGSNWWNAVGEWTESRSRFPSGLASVLDRIRDHDMVPGLWLEPEVVGVRSPLAETLPPEAFLSLGGQRIRETARYSLDLSHPAARRHLDETVDRLVELGVGYLKLDYNVNPGVGTDRGGVSPGSGLLRADRARADWLRGILERHPSLLLENCASGALRQDPLSLSIMQLQSTSDQEEALRYPPIAAAAPLSVLPEQSASWAYPQEDMSDEEAAFSLVTGLTGRFYLSGHVDRFAPGRVALVQEAVRIARLLHHDLAESFPTWPTGLPGWSDDAVTFARMTPSGTYVYAWNRVAESSPLQLAVPHLAGREVVVEALFPAFEPWDAEWHAGTGTLSLAPVAGEPSARLFRVRPAG